MTEIRSLLDRPADGEAPPRDLVEHTLTNGYAHALVLERKRLRLERRLRTLVRSAELDASEVAELTRLLAAVDQELAGLRALLASLRSHAL